MAKSGRNTELLHLTNTNTKSAPWREPAQFQRTIVCTGQPHNPKPKNVPVLYYLSRNGHLEHPHFIEVPLSSPHGLLLKDVVNRLNVIRGKGMASLYSWSCKRSYKNGFVWHDLSENDFIYPVHGNEYVLKGSELPESAGSLPPPSMSQKPDRRNHSCGSIEFEHNVYKEDPSSVSDAATQTEDSRSRRNRPLDEIVEEKNRKEPQRDEIEFEISPPPSDSSPETLERLMKAECRVERPHIGHDDDPEVQRCKSSVIMQLISCGSMTFKNCGAGQAGMGLMGHQYKMRVPRGGRTIENGGVKLEEKEYFSGSLVETKKEEFPGLKRSTSYNENRIPHLELPEKEIEGVRAKCMPTKPRAH